MTLFLTTSLGYPTLAWSIVLSGLLLFWLVAAVGIQGTVESLCDARHRPRADLVAHVVAAGRYISREFGHGKDQ